MGGNNLVMSNTNLSSFKSSREITIVSQNEEKNKEKYCINEFKIKYQIFMTIF